MSQIISEVAESIRKSLLNDDHGLAHETAKKAGLTAIYGYSDDLIEFIGICYDETGTWEEPKELEFIDGTKISVNYGKDPDYRSIWAITVLQKGTSEHFMIECDDEDSRLYSDLFVIESELCESAYE